VCRLKVTFERLKGVIWSWGIGGECSSGIERHSCARFFNLKSVPIFSIPAESIRSASNTEGGSTLYATHYNFCLYHVLYCTSANRGFEVLNSRF
jgi:hypothetical protein